MTPKEFNDYLSKQVLIIDGAMGTMIQNYGFTAEAYGGEVFQMLSDILVLSRPDAIKEIHLEYYRAGSQAVETNTFGASPLRLEEFDFSTIDQKGFHTSSDELDLTKAGIEELTYVINKKAAEIAIQAAKEYQAETADQKHRPFVLGSIGPSNWVLSNTKADLKKGSYEQVENNFYQQVKGLIDGGVDILLFETQQDMLELKTAIFGAKRAMKELGADLPIIAQVTVDQFSKMQIFHTDIHAALTTLQDIGIHAFGINCSIGPELMRPTVDKLSRFSKLPISVIPNAGLPESEGGQTVFKLTPEKLAEYVKTYVDEFGINIVGGCCGTTPDHIRAISKLLKGVAPKERNPDLSVHLAGPQNAIKLDSSTGLIRVGERLNVRGSKKVRLAVEGRDDIDQDALEEVVSEQVRDLGAEVIDVCMDSNIVDTPKTLVEIIKAQTIDFPGAMSIDSFEAEALGEAIKIYPGRPIINSISLDEVSPGVDKIDAVLPLTEAHSPIYVALTSGPKGPAVLTSEKIDLARQIIEKVDSEYGVTGDRIFVDINAFPIGAETSEELNFAMESINAIPEIKALAKGVRTIIGVGNLTNGLATKPYMRKVLTSVFLDEAYKKGLDAAIVNPNHYVPVESLSERDYALGKDVIFNRNMEAFEKLEEIALAKTGEVSVKRSNYDDLEDTLSVCQKIKDGYKEKVGGRIEINDFTYDYQDKIVEQAATIIRSGVEPLALINDHLMVAMDELGTGFSNGTVSLPHLLKSADVMKQVMGFLEAYLKESVSMDGLSQTPQKKGTIVLGTVYQDVHSIGKDLAKTLLENYGFNVIDLGVQVPLQDFIDAALAHNAEAMGLSALLVQTSNHMITISKMLQDQGVEGMTILIGGAPVSKKHAAQVAMAGVSDTDHMHSNVFYCRSAMDGVNTMNRLMSDENREAFFQANREELIQTYKQAAKKEEKDRELKQTLPRRVIQFPKEHPSYDRSTLPGFREIPLSEIIPTIDRKLLFSFNWRYGGSKGWEKKGVDPEMLEAKLQGILELSDKFGWFHPGIIYDLLPCRGGADQDQVALYYPSTERATAKLTFNDVIGEGKKDIWNVANYFQSEQIDVIGLQLSTAGAGLDQVIDEVKENDQELAWLIKGLGDRVAEDLANLANQELLNCFKQGETLHSCRYSPGYPAMTEFKNNQIICDLLGAEEKLKVKITEAFAFEPTSTTAAVVCFHPEVGYH